MKDGTAILKILSVQNFVLLNNDYNGILLGVNREYELKTTPFSLELFSFVKPLAGLVEEHLGLGATTTDRQVLKHLPSQVPA